MADSGAFYRVYKPDFHVAHWIFAFEHDYIVITIMSLK